jgi:hypothetical protein
MQPFEQMKAYLLWLQARGLETPIIFSGTTGALDIAESSSPKSNGFESPLKVIFLSDLPLDDTGDVLNPINFEEKNLLDRMIVAMKLRPEEYLITSVLPVNGRDQDLVDSINVEAKLVEIKELIQKRLPQLVITLGHQARKLAFRDSSDFWLHRGTITHSPELSGSAVLSTLHPRDLIRFQGNKRIAWTDLQVGMKYLSDAS